MTITATGNNSQLNTSRELIRADGALLAIEVTRSPFGNLIGTITPDGPAVPITLSTAGQTSTLNFNGTIGQRIFLTMTNVTLANSTVAILKPDGLTLISQALTSSGGLGYIDTQTLPQTGQYQILLTPGSSPPATFPSGVTFTLYNLPADVSGTITENAQPITISITARGQNAVYSLSAAAGDVVSVLLTQNTLGTVTLSLRNPDQTLLANTTTGSSTGSLTNILLNSAGSYSIVVDPAGGAMGTASLQVTKNN